MSRPSTGGSSRLRILAIDIETRPALVYTWSLWQPTIGLEQVVDPGGMMCFAAKWLGERKTEFLSDHHDGHHEMIIRAWELLDEADVVLHFNGASFDVPHIQREFMQEDMLPPAPFKQIDLYKTVKRQARFLSNKLAHVSKQLDLEGKVHHEGFRLWLRCLEGDETAWRKMRKYNIRDITLLEDLYTELRPWIVNHPSIGAFSDEDVCPRCGSDDLMARGFAFLKTGRYQRLQCKKCGSWTRSTKREGGTTITELAS